MSSKSLSSHVQRPSGRLAWSLPLKVQVRVTTALRMAWTTGITLVVIQYWKFVEVALYLAPVISIISSATYFGLWQEVFYKVIYSTIIGGVVGVVAGLVHPLRSLQLALLFCLFTWIGEIPNWDRTAKVFGGLSLILGILWPTLTGGQTKGFPVLALVLSLIMIPYLITGFSLLFPRPAFAAYTARSTMLVTCRRLACLAKAMLHAFVCLDQVDLHCAEFDELLIEVQDDMTVLKNLSRHIDYERLLFLGFQDMSASLQHFLVVAEKILRELMSIRQAVKNIPSNKTQEVFVLRLEQTLEEIGDEMEICFTVIGEHFLRFHPLACPLPSLVDRSLYFLQHGRTRDPIQRGVSNKLVQFYNVPRSEDLIQAHVKSHPEHDVEMQTLHKEQATEDGQGKASLRPSDSLDSEAQSLRHALEMACRRLAAAREQLLFGYNEFRRSYIYCHAEPASAPAASPSAEVHNPMFRFSFPTAAELPAENDRLADAEALLNLHSPLPAQDPAGKQQDDDILREKIVKDRNEENLLRLSVHEEILRLSLRNLNPRGAYLHRLSVLIEYVFSLQQVFDCKDAPGWMQTLAISGIGAFINYAIDTGSFFFMICKALLLCNRGEIMTSFTRMGSIFMASIQSLKIAAAVTLAASILVYDLIPFLYQGGFWATVVIALIRQDLTSSTFMTAGQRLEGTVIGCIYAFFIYQLFQCSAHHCGLEIHLPFLVGWVAFCGLFRDGPQHGYAALVAAFTPLVLLLGNFTTVQAAWGRVEETFLGMLIYLLIDVLIFPQRLYPMMTTSVLAAINDTRMMFAESVHGVETLMRLNEQRESQAENTTTTREEAEPEHKAPEATSCEQPSRLAPEASLVNYGLNPGQFDLHDDDPPLLKELYSQAKQRLDEADLHLQDLGTQVKQQTEFIRLVAFEPELWYRTFPQSVYQRLLAAFANVHRSGLAINAGAREFSILFYQMVRRGEHVGKHLKQLHYMIEHLFLVVNKSEEALALTHEAFAKLYQNQRTDIDLQSLLSLRRISERLLAATEEHFRLVVVRQPSQDLMFFNPYFIAAWQNLFESAIKLIRDLSELGMRLIAVRNVEKLLQL